MLKQRRRKVNSRNYCNKRKLTLARITSDIPMLHENYTRSRQFQIMSFVNTIKDLKKQKN